MKLTNFLSFAALLFFSIFAKPYKIKGRSWHAEFIFRLSKITIKRAYYKPINWLRQQELLITSVFQRTTNVHVKTDLLANQQCYWFSPTQTINKQNIIIYFHGGGFVLNGGLIYQQFCRLLAQKSNTTVVLIDYRLAPEHKYPAAHDDCFNMTKTLLEQFPQCRFQLIGDSAGATLLLNTYLKLTAISLNHTITSISLLSPWLAPTQLDKSMLNNESSDYLNHRILKTWLDAYCDPSNQPALNNIRNQLAFDALPPMLIQYSTSEIMADQIAEFVNTGRENGAMITCNAVCNLFHNFQIIGMYSPEGQQATSVISQFLIQNK